MERQRKLMSVGAWALRSTLNASSQRLCKAVAQLSRWRQLSQDRAELARMSDDRLRDIGLSRADVLKEYARPFWDDPLKR